MAERSSTRENKKRIGRFFYEKGCDFSYLESSSFWKLVNLTFGSEHVIPSRQDLEGWTLHDVVNEMKLYVQENRDSWRITGCSILLDEWKCSSRNLLYVLVDCPMGTIYLCTKDISDIYGDVDNMQLFIDEVLQDVGVENVVQIVSHSSSACMEELGRKLMEKHKTLFWTRSASHCIDLLLEKLENMDLMKRIFTNTKTFTRFIYSDPAILELLRCYSVADIVGCSKLKSARPFLILENIVLQKENLRKMCVSADWEALTSAFPKKGKMIADLMANESFWNDAGLIVKVTIPLVRVLHLINSGNEPDIGNIYEMMDQAKLLISEALDNNGSLYEPYWTVIDEIWDSYLHSHLHAAGNYFNPSLCYSTTFEPDEEVFNGLWNCINRMALEPTIKEQVISQVGKYGNASHTAFGRRSRALHPETAWLRHGGQWPELQRIAVRVLSQKCNGASKYGLNGTMAGLAVNETDPAKQEMLHDLAFVHYNLLLQKFRPNVTNDLSACEIGLKDEWTTSEEEEDANDEAGLACGVIITHGRFIDVIRPL